MRESCFKLGRPFAWVAPPTCGGAPRGNPEVAGGSVRGRGGALERAMATAAAAAGFVCLAQAPAVRASPGLRGRH